MRLLETYVDHSYPTVYPTVNYEAVLECLQEIQRSNTCNVIATRGVRLLFYFAKQV